MTKALIAMSGGVDSSVTAYLMKQRGFDCIGVTFRMFDKNDTIFGFDVIDGDKDIQDAKAICDKLGIPFIAADATGRFRKHVIDNFINTYEKGGTPNPCVECNKHIKFALLNEIAEEYGCDIIATGHYAKVDSENGRFFIRKADDEKKDQSYFLYSLSQKQLKKVVFPLAEITKDEARVIAEKNGFVNAHKKDSQDTCFISGNDYIEFIHRATGKNYPKGKFIDTTGKVLGIHNGIINYTIGQRKGLGIALGAPAYVKEKNVTDNTVMLSSNDELFKTEIIADKFSFMAIKNIDGVLRCTAKIRYAHKGAAASVIQIDNTTVKITFDEPQRAPAKGQSVVLYDGDKVLGGGTIK